MPSSLVLASVITFASRHKASLAERSVRANRPRQRRWISFADRWASSSSTECGTSMSAQARLRPERSVVVRFSSKTDKN